MENNTHTGKDPAVPNTTKVKVQDFIPTPSLTNGTAESEDSSQHKHVPAMSCGAYDSKRGITCSPKSAYTRGNTKKIADHGHEGGPSLKLQCFDANCQPLPAFLFGNTSEDEKQKGVQEGHRQLLKKIFDISQTVPCTKEALDDLLGCLDKHVHTTGVIFDQDLNPDGNQSERDAHYIMEKLLGKGSFGTVHLAMDSNRGKKFVHKQISKESFAKNEVLVHSQLNQVNITRLYGVIHRVSPGGEHMELLFENAGMSLNKYIAKHPEMAKTEAVIWYICKQGFQAFEHMDKFGITHLDIKPENVCLTDQEDGLIHMKITNFGSAKFAHEPMHFVRLTCTPEYLSPELCQLVLQKIHKGTSFGLSDYDITGKTDMFSFALVIMFIYKGFHILQHVITNGKNSYDGYPPEKTENLRMMLIVQVAQEKNFVKLFIPDESSMDMRHLLSKMLENNPMERFSAKEALKAVKEIAQEPMKSNYGPGSSAIKDRLRNKICDSHARGAKGSGMGRMVTETSQSTVLTPQCVASKEMTPRSPMADVHVQTVYGPLPEIAQEPMKSNHVPVNSAIKDRLRKKISDPYCREAKGSQKKRNLTERSQSAVIKPRHVASKEMPPMSTMGDTYEIVGVTHRNAPIAQPADNDVAMGIAPSPMINIRRRALPQYAYPPAASDALPVDCRRANIAQTAEQCQVTGAQLQLNEQDMRRLTEAFQNNGGKVIEPSQQMLIGSHHVPRAGIDIALEQNRAEVGNMPQLDKIMGNANGFELTCDQG